MKLIDEKTLKKIKSKKICIVTGTGEVIRKSKNDMLAENDTFETSKALHTRLKQKGFEHLEYFFATEDNLDLLSEIQADIFLNLAEGSREDFLNLVCKKLKKLQIPFSGSQEEANIVTTNKYACKNHLKFNSINSPPAIILNPYEIEKIEKIKIDFPSIVKPVFEDGSTGITQKSVVENMEKLIKQCKTMFKTYNEPVIVEKYIEGREFAATILKIDDETKVLPIAETVFDFKKTASRKWKIYSYAAKWLHHSEEYLNTPVVTPPKNLSEKVIKEIESQATRTFEKFNLFDYARIDFRFDEKTEELFVIDINANPSLELNEDYSLYSSVLASGNDIDAFVGAILASAFRRFGQEI